MDRLRSDEALRGAYRIQAQEIAVFAAQIACERGGLEYLADQLASLVSMEPAAN